MATRITITVPALRMLEHDAKVGRIIGLSLAYGAHVEFERVPEREEQPDGQA